MAGIRVQRSNLNLNLNLLLVLTFPSVLLADQSAFRTLRLSSSGPAARYGAELVGAGGPVRIRRTGGTGTGTGTGGLPHQIKLSGVNVCGGQCCTGWSKSPGSQRCTKPNCLPKCQNGGMCLRPQMCVCKPGLKGKLCEQTTPPISSKPPRPGTGHGGGHGGHGGGHNVVPQRPIPQQMFPQSPVQYPVSSSGVAHMTLTMKASPSIQHHVQLPASSTLHQGKSQKFVIKPKFYPPHTAVYPPERSIPLSVGPLPLHAVNHTGRIKLVFTPTICKLTCSGGRCHNTCEKGNTTTIISENGRATDTLTAPNFRVVVCHLPCMNGGKCNARDKCQCPPNFTGKFCQMPMQNGQSTQIHTTHTLPLTYSHGQSKGVVNIHVNHPPEASVQIHQVSQVDSSSSSSTLQKVTQQHSSVYQNQQSVLHYQPISSKSQLGRCFQETTSSQCGKALPGLSKQEDCCGTFGTSWGFHKCQKCQRKTSVPLFECPQGFKRFNSTRCIDVNECQLQGVCPNGNCVNAPGSYRCSCKAGFISDATHTNCYPETPPLVHEEEMGACFRVYGGGRQCLHPVSTELSKQLCCCSVGKAWGARCERCPLPGTAAFKEICPGGLGYHVTTPYIYKPRPPPPPKRVHPEEPEREVRPRLTHQETTVRISPLPVPTVQQPIEAFGFTERHLPLPELVEKTSPALPVAILPSSASQDIPPTQLAEVDECIISPDICGAGICYNTQESYTCICDTGYTLNEERSTCVDIDECENDLNLCTYGRCRNTPGSFACICQFGFILKENVNSCVDVNECEVLHLCPENSVCINTFGSYTCRQCSPGYRVGQSGQCEDVNECQNGSVCRSGLCYNTLGSYMCSSCPDGFEGRDGKCVDIDECADGSACVHGQCSNHEGYFICTCDDGFTPSADRKACTDIDECQDESVCTRGHCQNTEGSFICNCDFGFTLSESGEQCDDVDECQQLTGLCDDVGQCVNNIGSYSCNCPPGYRQINGTRCQDIDECVEEAQLIQYSTECVNTEGSYYFLCESGYTWIQDPPACEDVDECALNRSVCRNGICQNTEGSFVCQCDTGYQNSHNGERCEDLNECMLLSDVCGDAVCENVPGSFLCTCPDEGLEFNRLLAKCLPTSTAPERRECYYNLNNENLCENVLASNVTMKECCCTIGAGWGDNCEIFPCPQPNSDQFSQMCPAGKGLVPNEEDSSVDSYEDADECNLFKDEICKDGFCHNTNGAYECYCKTGLYHDEMKLSCVDTDECLDEMNCVGGQCLNTHGSYHCFCPPPLIPDSTNNRCITPDVAEHREQSTFHHVCWERVTGPSMTCSNPLRNKMTTYTECCCLHGEAWGIDCALCPPKHSAHYASICNTPVRRPYGRDALVAGGDHQYEVDPEYDPQPLDPNPHLYEDYDELVRYEAFEGSRAEECGVLNGCENGQCVRVQMGYTCVCFDGYTLDMSRMACVDVNECSELCRNGKCVNTPGSFRCVCLPGYTLSELNHCIPIMSNTNTATE